MNRALPVEIDLRGLRVGGVSLLALCLATGTAGHAGAADLSGSESLARMVQEVLASCPGASAINYLGGGSDRGELLMMSGVQKVAPMARLLDVSRTCSLSTPQESEGLMVALDTATVVANHGTADACPGAAIGAGSVMVGDVNGVPGLECPGCSEGSYTLDDWRDGLRVLYAGMHHDAGSNLAGQDCNSDVRHAIAGQWDALLGGVCPSGTCSEVRHLWRPGDRSGTAEILLALLGLPPVPSAVFCNGAGAGPFPDPAPASHPLTDFLDVDPIRRPCHPGETACGRDGTLGLVTVAEVPTNLAPGLNYPAALCMIGKFRLLRPAPTGVTSCPNGLGLLFGKCFQPVVENPDGTFTASCVAGKVPVQGFFGNGMDGRAYNLVLKNADGSYARDARNRLVTGATFRVHSNAVIPGGTAVCRDAATATQIGCLAQASPCSMGVGNFHTASLSGAAAVMVANVAPTLQNVRRHVAGTGDPLAYPLATPLLLNSFVGLDALTSPAEGALAGCFSSASIVEGAATASGLVTLGAPPRCVDFDERLCGGGGLFNRNSCMKRAFNWCPDIDQVIASPLQVTVGGTINVSGTGSDLDDDPLESLWTATAGSFAAPAAGSTTYACTVVGSQTLTFRLWDGLCETTHDIPVTCKPP